MNERPQARITDLVEELTAHLLDSTDEDDEEASLRTVFSWSFNALRPEAAQLFRLLGLYPGPNIGPPAAAALLGMPQRLFGTEQILNALAKAHLINHDTAQRYRFHDLLRRYAADRAHSEEAPEQSRTAMRRLLDWYLLSAINAATRLAPHRPPVPDLPAPVDVEPLTFATDISAMRWCEAERANLAAMTRWANGNEFHRHAWQIPAAMHEVFERFGRQDDMLELHRLALTSADRDGHQIGQLASRNNMGAIQCALHNYRSAAEHFDAALRLAHSFHRTEVETAAIMHNVAHARLKTGEIEIAIRICENLVEVCRRTNNPNVEGAALHRLGDANRQLKRHDRAAAFYLEALAVRERLGSWRAVGKTRSDLAALYLEVGQLDRAHDHCRQAIDLNERANDQAALCDALTTMADVALRGESYPEAFQHAYRSLAIGEAIADPERRCRALTVLAETLAATGDATAARRISTEALAIADEVANPGVQSFRGRLRATLRSLNSQ